MIFAATYDVQSVNGSAIVGGLNLSCTFAEGSQAQSCILTVCKVENGNSEGDSCMIITIARNRQLSTSSNQVTNFEPGLYSIRNVEEIESDSAITTVQLGVLLNSLNFWIVEAPPSTPSFKSQSIAGVIAGGKYGSKQGLR